MVSHPTNCACDFCKMHIFPLSITAMDQELIAPSFFPQMREGQLSFGRLDIIELPPRPPTPIAPTVFMQEVWE